ncbi:MAG TPA: hypothetical protein VGN18_18635 [Jatrophihabitans sp.]|jgi:hypothetical protein|uniref:hypothetical protein n=1 Tax=Jatrophihabitans sp. TaxID=1932789 RepID=UPI002E09685F|nr:hypothetical protein [Jatrophihabitans sp.]
MTDDGIGRTRRALHAVAEHVLAGPQYRASGTIRLRVAPGGFRTWAEPALAVVGDTVVHGATVHPISGRTARELAAACGVEVGAPAGVYGDGGGLGPDDVLEVDPGAARLIADAYARGDAALRLLAPGVEPVLWPEHFDVGVRVGEVNFGVSPGDADLAEPYAYVGVDPVPDDPYWNAPFGRAAPMAELATIDDVWDFFDEGRRRAGQ